MAREIEATYPKDKILELYLNQIDLGQPRLRGRGGVPALLRQIGPRPERRRGRDARRHPQGPVALQPAQEPEPERPAPEHGPEPAAGQRAAVGGRTRSGGRRIRCCSRRTRTSAASPSTSSSTCASSSTPASAPTSTSRATGSTPRSTSTPSRPPSARSRPGSRPSRAVPTASSPGRPTGSTSIPAPTRPDDGTRTTTPYLQGLVVTLDAKTGNIRAMVGGRDFEDSKFNRATQALRQPGSTFKPIVYSAAVEAGYPLSHVMVDDPLTVEIATDAGALGPAELRPRVRRPDDAPPRALYVAQHHRHQARHGDRRGRRHQRGHQVRHHDADPARIHPSTSARRT